MAYITSEYYLDVYNGIPNNPAVSLTTTIQRASDAIDSLTGYKLQTSMSIETVHPFIKANVEKATAALVEYYLVNGGHDTFMQSNAPDVSLGSFSYSMKTSSGKAKEVEEIPSNVIHLLGATGLLYAGINTSGGGVYFDN